MSTVTEHPSYLALDRAALGHASGLAAEHLGQCDECRAYVEALQRPVHVPSMLREKVHPRPWFLRLRPLWWVPAMAASLVVGFVSFRAGESTHPAVTAKGMPAVAVYVKRGESVSLWDGRLAIHPGDRLRFKVAPEEFQQVTIATLEPSTGQRRVLFQSPIPAHQDWLLPEALLVDGAPGDERFLFVLSHTPLDVSRLGELPTGSGAVWTTTLVLPKASATEGGRP